MAKIMLGSLAGAISGALGNDVFSHNRHGYYVRRRVIPTKVTSTYTTEVRNILTACSRAWGALPVGSQTAWNTWAASHPITDRLGQKQTLFGAGAYTQLNARILFAGDTAITVPPVAAAPSPFTAFSITASDAPTLVPTFLPTPLAATERLWFQACLLVNPGQNYFKNLLKTVFIGGLASASLVDMAADMELRFGTMAAGNRIIALASVYEKTSGLLSGPTIATCTVT
jgi:hypothetical protein